MWTSTDTAVDQVFGNDRKLSPYVHHQIRSLSTACVNFNLKNTMMFQALGTCFEIDGCE